MDTIGSGNMMLPEIIKLLSPLIWLIVDYALLRTAYSVTARHDLASVINQHYIYMTKSFGQTCVDRGSASKSNVGDNSDGVFLLRYVSTIQNTFQEAMSCVLHACVAFAYQFL